MERAPWMTYSFMKSSQYVPKRRNNWRDRARARLASCSRPMSRSVRSSSCSRTRMRARFSRAATKASMILKMPFICVLPVGVAMAGSLGSAGIAPISVGKQFVSGLYTWRVQPTRVLVVDDDPAIRQMLAEYLSAHGYAVAQAASGKAMRTELERAVPAVVLLDVGLPGEDGLTLARYLRERYDLGIIMVTGADEVVDRVAGLEVGADDYIAKPFDPRELRARLKSVLRRIEKKESPRPQPRVPIGKCLLDMKSRTLSDAKGREVPITSME